jgi:hypothetical protein
VESVRDTVVTRGREGGKRDEVNITSTEDLGPMTSDERPDVTSAEGATRQESRHPRPDSTSEVEMSVPHTETEVRDLLGGALPDQRDTGV